MPQWGVTLIGEQWALGTLVGLGVGVSQEGDGFVLRSPDLDDLSDAREVEQRARKLVAVLNGLARIEVPDFTPVAVSGGIVKYDGGRREFSLHCEPDEYRLRPGLTQLIGPDRQRATPPPRPMAAWAALAQRDANARQVLGLFAEQPDPVNLYRVFEVIRADVGGEDALIANGWTSGNQITRFRRTANSVSALGTEARHGVEPTAPPANPMSGLEMQTFVTGLLEKWLASKK